MTISNPSEISFNGICLSFDSKKRFDELVSALLGRPSGRAHCWKYHD